MISITILKACMINKSYKYEKINMNHAIFIRLGRYEFKSLTNCFEQTAKEIIII